MSLSLGLTACDARANQPPPVPAPPVQPEPREFDPSVVDLEPGGAVAEVRHRQGTQGAQAALHLALSRLDSADAASRGRLQWLIASIACGADDPAPCRPTLEMLATSEHPLAPWGQVRLAEVVEESDPTRAAALTSDLTTEWGGAQRARRIRARSLSRSGQEESAIPILREMVAATPSHLGAASSAIPLARILANQSDSASHEEAISLYRRVASRAPLTAVGRESARAASALVQRLPAERRDALRDFSVAQRLARANAYMQSRRFEQAETEFRELAESLPASSEHRCEALLNQGRAILRRRAREQGSLHMDRVVEECEDATVVAAALYNAARAHARRGRHQEAITRYERIAREFPQDTLGDDALYRAALLVEDHEGEPAALRRLEEIPNRFPDGDMRTKIQFRLAWIHFEAGRYDRAEEILNAAMSSDPLETAEDIRGRLAYWRARVIAEQGRSQEAIEAYAELFRQWPLSYYAQQALARLRELSPSAAQSIIADLRDDEPEGLRFSWRREFEEPAFARAIELLKVGETELAEDELDAMGFLAPNAERELVWVVASLLHRVGSLPRSSRLARLRLQHFHSMMPTGRARNLWRVAYPNAFSPLLDDIARAAEVPPTFVRAVAREESAFNPRAVSVAHAYGLIQLIPPTARRFARPLGLPATREALFDPETNLRIGSNYIAFLRGTYSQNHALVPAGYNAGHGAVNRWLRARGTQPLDQFIENIPYDETRRYSRRVLQTYGVYAWLDEGQLPELKRSLQN